jgi:hypothetical protein
VNHLALGALVGAVASGIVVWLIQRPSAEAPILSSEAVTLSRPKTWKWLASVMTLTPLIGVVRIYRETDPGEARGFAFLMVLGCAVGASFFIPALRRIVFSRNGIQTLGFPRRSITWEETAEIQGFGGTPLWSLRFTSTDGTKIVVDARMVGWEQLLERLPELCAENSGAQSMVSKALLGRDS